MNGVPSWRWASDQYIAESPAVRAAPIYDEIRKSAEKNPNKVVVCGVEGPKTVYTTNAVCNAVISFDKDYYKKLKLTQAIQSSKNAPRFPLASA